MAFVGIWTMQWLLAVVSVCVGNGGTAASLLRLMMP